MAVLKVLFVFQGSIARHVDIESFPKGRPPSFLELALGPLSKKAELMVGIGPEWVHVRESGVVRKALGAEFALDFMCWPGSKHGFGWFIEPAFEYTFGHETCAIHLA